MGMREMLPGSSWGKCLAFRNKESQLLFVPTDDVTLDIIPEIPTKYLVVMWEAGL